MDCVERGKIVSQLEDVSAECRKSLFCKSSVLPDGRFVVETSKYDPECGITDPLTNWIKETAFKENILLDKQFETSEYDQDCNITDPRTVWIKETTDEEKINNLDILLEESGFFDVVDDKCKKDKHCKIVVKANISSAMRLKNKQFTDPEIVDHIIDVLNEKGYENTEIVESESSVVLAHPSRVPDIMGKKLGYKHEVKDLSKDDTITVKFNKGQVDISKRLIDADVIINVPKIKNHQLQFLTGALKNMYGSLPVVDKFSQFHFKESGLSIEEATIAANHATGVDFVIGDMIHSIDRHKDFFKPEDEIHYFKANLLFAGRDPLALDKVVEAKMGYEENQSPIIKEEIKFRGNVPRDEIPVIGGDLSNICGWKKEDQLRYLTALTNNEFARSLFYIAMLRMIGFDDFSLLSKSDNLN